MPTDDPDSFARSAQEIVDRLDRLHASLDEFNKGTKQLLSAINANTKTTNDLVLIAKRTTGLKLVPTYEATWDR